MTMTRISGSVSQATFDALMRSLSEPGRVRSLPEAFLETGAPALSALGLALADVGVTVAANRTAHQNSNPPVAELVAAATGAATTQLSGAWIAMLDQPTEDEIRELPRGSAWEPELGARVAISVDEIGNEPFAASTELTLTGPGVPSQRSLFVTGVSRRVLAGLGQSSGDYPAGLDAWLFTADGRVAAIPRSATLTISQEQN